MAGTISQGIKDLFWKLSSVKSSEREAASIELLAKLNLVTTNAKQNGLNDSPLKNDNAEGYGTNAEELQYALDRLLKGLASVKSQARLGFSLALTLVLERLSKRQIRAAFARAEQCLLAMKTETKLEETSKKLGSAFLAASLSRSGAFAKLTAEQKALVVDQLLLLAERRDIADLASSCLSRLLQQLSAEEFNASFFSKQRDRLACGWAKLDANRLLLLLSATAAHKETVGKGYLKANYGTKRLLAEDNFPHLIRICAASTEGREAGQQHPVVQELLRQLLASCGARRLAGFSRSLAETHCSADSPARCKALVFSSLAWTAQQEEAAFSEAGEPAYDKAACLGDCFTDTACRQLLAQLANRNSVLHSLAADWLGRCVADEQSASTIGAVFDRLTSAEPLFDASAPAGSRLCRLLPRLPADSVAGFVRRLRASAEEALEAAVASATASANANAEASPTPDVARRVAASAQLLRHCAVACRQSLGHKLSASLLLLIASAALRLPGDSRHRRPLVAAFVKSLDSLARAAGSAGAAGQRRRREHRRLLSALAAGLLPLLPGNEEDDSVAARCLRSGLRLLAVGSDGVAWGFTIVYLHLGFHCALAADAGVTWQLLDDVDECERRASAEAASAANGERQQQQQQQQEEKEEQQEQLRWPDVLLDSLLSLLPSASHLLRSVVRLAVGHVAELVSIGGVRALCQMMLSDADERPPASASDEEDDDEEDEEEEDEDEDDEKKKKEEEEEEFSISVSSDDEGGADDDDTEPVDEEFRRACKSALGDAACPSDAEADPSDLSDSAMERVDAALSLAFKARRRRLGVDKKSASARRRQVWQLRLRLLDAAEALLEAKQLSADCRLGLVSGVGRLALAAARGGGGVGGAGGATEREQALNRALAALRRESSKPDDDDASSTLATSADEESTSAAEAALAELQRSPCPPKLSLAGSQLLSSLLRLRPLAMLSLLSRTLANQLSASERRPRANAALWQRLCREQPRLLWEARDKLLAAIGPDSRLRPHDRATFASVAAGAFSLDAWQQIGGEAAAVEFCQRLADCLLPLLAAEAAGVTSARLFASLLGLAAVLLRRRPELAGRAPPELPQRLAGVSCKGSDLRRALRACRQLLLPLRLRTTAPKEQQQKRRSDDGQVAGSRKRRLATDDGEASPGNSKRQKQQEQQQQQE